MGHPEVPRVFTSGAEGSPATNDLAWAHEGVRRCILYAA